MDQKKVCQDLHTPQEPGGAEQQQQHQEQNLEFPLNQDNQANCILPHIQEQLNSAQVQEIQGLQIEVHHEPNVQSEQDPQYQEKKKKQSQEDKRLHMQLNQEIQTHSNQTLQSQQISTSSQLAHPLLAPDQCQEKQSSQHQEQAKSHNHTEEKSLQCHQEQQLKKKEKKRKLAMENQERINYLAQASKAVGLAAAPSTSVYSLRAMAAQVGSVATAVGRRCVLRLAPELKRCLCKGCGTTLVYGVNAKVRHWSRRQKHLVVTCLTCYTIKRFNSNPRHQLWLEQEEAEV